jgi:hypothetical protein
MVQRHKWRADPIEVGRIDDADVAMYGAVGRKL